MVGRQIPLKVVTAGGERPLAAPRSGAGPRRVQPPLSVYVHVPWCVRKCPYCDFNSHALAEGAGLPEEQYLGALRADLESALPLVWGRPVGSVFLGGGTPSLLSPEAIEALLSDLRSCLALAPDCEITLEANPGTVENARLAAFRAAGVTRVSIGVQSFDGEALQRLGRIHDPAQALAAADAARRHFEQFNLDLMYALPGQTLDEARRDLEIALGLAPPHLSIYQLTVEPNTLFARYPPELPDEDSAAAMQEAVEAATAAAGYEHYEVSAYARPGAACRHNLNYWRFGDYLGLGAGAHGKLSLPDRIVRQRRHRNPATYLEQARAGRFVAEEHVVGAAELPFEFMLNALRLTRGFETGLFAERTGLPLAAIEGTLRLAERQGLLVRDQRGIRPTAQGRRFLNDLQALFLPDDGARDADHDFGANAP